MHTANDQPRGTVLLFPRLDRNVHLVGTLEHPLVGEGYKTKLLESIVRVGDEFTEENVSTREAEVNERADARTLPVRVQAVKHTC